MFVILMSSVGHQYTSYDYENNKSRQKPKIQQKSARNADQINFGCSKKEGVPVIAETDLLFMEISLISVNQKKLKNNYLKS